MSQKRTHEYFGYTIASTVLGAALLCGTPSGALAGHDTNNAGGQAAVSALSAFASGFAGAANRGDSQSRSIGGSRSNAVAGHKTGAAGATAAHGAARGTSGQGGDAAKAATLAEALAKLHHGKPVALAKASAGAAGGAHDANGAVHTTSGSVVAAKAVGGATPKARARAGSDTYAKAVGGKHELAVADAGPHDITRTTHVHGEVIAVAYTKSGSYAYAVATRHSAAAYATTFGNGVAFVGHDLSSAAQTAAEAFASASMWQAHAMASAYAAGSGSWAGGASSAWSSAHASASLATAPQVNIVSGSGHQLAVCAWMDVRHELLCKAVATHG